MADWAGERVGLSFIPPGEPWRNGYVESFNARIRDECLNINIFWSLAQARVVISDWKHDYNHHRRHSALGYQPPARYAETCTHGRTRFASLGTGTRFRSPTYWGHPLLTVVQHRWAAKTSFQSALLAHVHELPRGVSLRWQVRNCSR